MDVTAVVATFGEPSWAELARTRAMPSAEAQGIPAIHVHDEDLAASRNAGLAQAESEWVTFLDADDEFGDGYLDAMAQGSADVRVPMLRFIRGESANLWQPRVWRHQHDCVAECVTSGEGNWIPAGTVAKTWMVNDVGGWRNWPVFEDFDLWMRVLLAGASVELVRDAIYVAHVRPDSRNRAPSQELKDRTHWDIVAANRPLHAA